MNSQTAACLTQVMGYISATAIVITMLLVDGETAAVTGAAVAGAGAGIGQYVATRAAKKAE